MDRHGQVVAKAHKLKKGPSADKLLKRLESNEKTLLEVRNLLVESIRSDKTITDNVVLVLSRQTTIFTFQQHALKI